MDPSKIREELAEITLEDDLLYADGFDDCILGICERFGGQTFVVYDRTKVIDKLMKDGLTYEEAEEHFSFNIIGSWVGDFTPGYVSRIEDL